MNYYLISEKTHKFLGYYSIDKLASELWCRKSTVQFYAKSHEPYMGYIIGYGIYKQEPLFKQEKTEISNALF